VLPNIVLFEGQNTAGENGLWETTGTGSGTFELAPTGADASGLSPSAITVLSGAVLFEGLDSSGGFGLWTTDGTAAGTQELTGIVGASSAGIAPTDLTAFGTEALFSGDNASNQIGLWTTDGTAAGTQELTGIVGAASTGITPTDLTVFNGEALFNGANTAGDLGLWVTNGTATGTLELTGIAGTATTGVDPTDMAVFNSSVLFNGVDASGDAGLWVTNGTAAGTHELTGIVGANTTGNGLNPTDLTVFGGKVLFSGLDASGDMGLWVTNGTAAGTEELTGITGADPSGLAPSDLTVYNGEVLFCGLDQSGRPQLWVTNGTAAGTHELTVKGASAQSGLNPSNLVVYDGQVLFSGLDSSGFLGLWTTNGTATGTTEVAPISGTQSRGLSPVDLTAIGPAPPPPTIAGTVSGQTTTSEAPVRPFASATIGDPNVGATDTLTITLGGAGGTLSGKGLSAGVGGVYTLSGTASAITSEVEALAFTPKAGAPNTSSTTTFRLSDQSTAGSAPAVDTATTVIDKDPTATGAAPQAPTIAGTVSNQTTTSEAPVRSFAHAMIRDPNVGVTDTLTITLGGAGGSLSGTGLSAGVGGVYTLSGTASAITSELEALVFTPKAGAPNTSSTTTFRLSDQSSAGGAPAVDTATTVIDKDPSLASPDVDFNDDGHSDILWQNADGQAAIWEMNGTKQIAGGSQLVGPNPGPNWKAVGTGDFNDDGHSDILWQNADGQAAIWEMNGTNQIAGGSQLVGPNPGPSWKVVGTGDFNDDGHSDILWQNADGQAAIWEMNGTNLIGSTVVGPNPGPSWKVIG
jgi:ELWxxDGT repeat protein